MARDRFSIAQNEHEKPPLTDSTVEGGFFLLPKNFDDFATQKKIFSKTGK
jgi:hypothetical protein